MYRYRQCYVNTRYWHVSYAQQSNDTSVQSLQVPPRMHAAHELNDDDLNSDPDSHDGPHTFDQMVLI